MSGFLETLDSSGVFTFQTFDDNDQRKDPSLARILHGTHAQHERQLRALNARGAGVFVMVNEGSGSGRSASGVQRVRAVFLDFDTSGPEALRDCIAGAKAAGLPPHLVCESSPGKFHVYWMVHDCPTESFRRVQECLAWRFGGDPIVKDLSRVMRVPGYLHRKGTPFESRLLHSRHGSYSVVDLVNGLGLRDAPKAGVARAGPTIKGSEWSVPTGGARDALAGASEGGRNQAIFKYACSLRARGTPLDEAEILVLAAASRCDPPLAELEARQVLANAWRYENTTAEAAPGAEPWRLKAIGRYTIDGRGITFVPPAVDGETSDPLWVLSVPLWVKWVGEAKNRDGVSGAGYRLHWIAPHDGPKESTLPGALLAGGREFKAWLGERNLLPFCGGGKGVEHLNVVISQMGQEWLRNQGAQRLYTSLGWHDEGFVLGDEVYTPKGVQPAKTDTAIMALNKASRAGTLDGWKEAAADICAAGLRQQAVLLLGFGSPLLGLSGRGQGAVVSLCGDSGSGKTTALHLAASIYTKPHVLAPSAQGTQNWNEVALSASRNVMLGLDESSLMSAKQAAAFIYAAANGSGKGTLQRNRSARETGEWSQIAFTTSNKSLLEFSEADINEATRRRVLEIEFHDAIERRPGSPADVGLSQHYGTAAQVYLPRLVELRDSIPDMLVAAERKITAKYPMHSANRFGIWVISAALVGGSIAHKLGLIDFNPADAVNWLCGLLSEQSKTTHTESDRVEDTVADWLTDRAANIVHWQSGGIAAEVRQPVARIDGAWIYVHASPLLTHCRDQHISHKHLSTWVKAIGGRSKTVRIAGGTPPVRCYALPVAALNIPDPVEPTDD